MGLRVLAWTAALLAASTSATAQTFTMVSAASYQNAVAPDSLATIFGVNLAAAPQSATLDANGQLPRELAGTSVTVDGRPAPLVFVSPTQINCLIPAATTPGAVAVTVQSTVTGTRQSGTVQVTNSAPGIFTSDASGKGPGSMLNAVTYAAPPFLVETAENGGADLRTRVAVYGTGLRFAGNTGHDPSVVNVAASVQAQVQAAEGIRYDLTVEYAGPAPGYFGLDQVNFVLPAELDGAGTVTLLVTTGLESANPVTFQIASLPPTSVRLNALTLSSSFVQAGDSVNGTVSLNAPARSAGVPVTLRSSSPLVQLPLMVSVPAGKTSAQFAIGTTSTVTTVQSATITAQSGGVTRSAELEVVPPNALDLLSFTAAAGSVQGGRTVNATVTLTGTAAAGGSVVRLASDNGAAQPPASVTVPFGANAATFAIATSAVTAPQTATLTATLGRTSRTITLAIAPPLQLALSSSAVVGGTSVTGTVTVGDAAPPAGVTVNLRSDNATIAQTPLNVIIPSGQTSTTFTVTTIGVTLMRTVTLTATLANSTQSATASLTVNPPGSTTLASLGISPGQVTGGSDATATITLTGPAPVGGTVVTVQSNSPYARVPQLLITVPQGLSAVTFTVTTVKPPSPQTAVISATAGGITRTATLSVQ